MPDQIAQLVYKVPSEEKIEIPIMCKCGNKIILTQPEAAELFRHMIDIFNCSVAVGVQEANA